MAIYAIRYPTYKPAMRIITAITRTNPAIVTTSFENSYVDDQIVRLHIPENYGMGQINNQYGTIKIIDAFTFSIDIDSSLYDPFVVPVGAEQQAQVVSVGNDGFTQDTAYRNVLPY